MHFLVIGHDRVGKGELRARLRPAHLEYILDPFADIKLALGGPLLAADQKTMIGSLLVFEAADIAAVERFMVAEPFNKGELFESLTVTPWRWTVGNPHQQ